jgi:hypothetical protein
MSIECGCTTQGVGRGDCIALPGSESAVNVEEIGLDDDYMVLEFTVALWTECSEDDDKRLKDRQACASRLTAFH